MSNDALIDAIVSRAETPFMIKRFGSRNSRAAGWKSDEVAFYRANVGVLPVEVIAEKLGRSVNAVHTKQIRLQLPAPSKRPGFLTGHQAAKVLGVDIHCVMLLHKRGLLPTVRVPGERGILNIRVTRLYSWAVNPQHWMYFKTAKMGDRHLARLVELAQSRWGDEWWSIGKTAQHHGVTVNGINQQIQRGKIPGAVDWGNWWIRKSEAMALVIRPGKGSNKTISRWTPAADAFLVRAYEMGLTTAVIGKMMKRDPRAVNHHMRQIGLKRSPQWRFERKQ